MYERHQAQNSVHPSRLQGAWGCKVLGSGVKEQWISRVYYVPQVLKLVDMGFDRTAVIQALQSSNGDENAALEMILSSC